MTYETADEIHELAGALEDLPDNFLMCRDMRHAWELEQDFYVERDVHSDQGNIRRRLFCLRCQMIRVERYQVGRFDTLVKIGQTYHAPDGYALSGVPRGNKPAAVIQAEQYRRAQERVAAAYRTPA